MNGGWRSDFVRVSTAGLETVITLILADFDLISTPLRIVSRHEFDNRMDAGDSRQPAPPSPIVSQGYTC